MRALLLITLVSLATVLSGCNRSRHEITGKWRSPNESNPLVWEFSANGRVSIGTMQGRYSFGDRDRIKIVTPSSTSVYQLQLSEDRMTLTDPRGSKLEFIRVK